MVKKYKVLLDTNFVLLPFEYNVDILSELERILPINYEIIVTSSIISELKNKGQKGKKGLDFIKYNNIKIEKYNLNGDEGILKYCLENNNIILATNDKELRKKAIENKIPVVYLRNKKYLEIRGLINV